MHHYPFHIGDFRAGCIHMTKLERWMYRDLLDVVYDTERPLPADHQNSRETPAFRPGKDSAKPVRASLGANDQSAAVVREHQPCVPFPIARA